VKKRGDRAGRREGRLRGEAPAGPTGDPAADREATQREGIACYRMLISGLLDLTDNLHNGQTVPPTGVVRHDSDDSYLVVAADKGTATFSDIANRARRAAGVLAGRCVRLGRVGGLRPQGHGHHRQGRLGERQAALPASSAPTPVGVVHRGRHRGHVRRRVRQRHALSEHIKLVAAFDHRHIFVDPNPSPARSFAERPGCSRWPRSSWEDYAGR